MAISELNIAKNPPSEQPGAALARRAAEMVENALRYCEGKANRRGRDQIVAGLQLEDPTVHDYFRYSLARQIGEYLAGLDETVEGVYTHSFGDAEEEGEDRSCSVCAPINLILRVQRRTAALSSIAACLDQALLQEYRGLVKVGTERMSAVLDVQVADARDVAEGVGYGAILRSIHTRPTQVWPA